MAKSAILAVRIVGDAVSGVKALDKTNTTAGKLFNKLGTGGKVALGMATAIQGAAAASGIALYKIGDTWNTVREDLRVGTGATGEDLEAMFEGVKNVASEIPAAISDIGPAMADVNTRMGLTGDTLETVTSQYLEAGRILGQEIDIAKTSAAFNAFAVEGENVVGAMDHLFQVSQATGIGMNELAGTVASSAPAVQALGFSFEETASMVGSFDKAGLNSSQIMSSMSRSLVNLAKDGEEPADAFNRVVGEIDGFLGAGDKAAAIDLAGKVFGTRGAAQFIGALESGTLNLEDMTYAAGQTGDTILGLGQETMNASEKWDVLKNKALVALEPIASSVFDGAGAALDWLTGVIDRIDFTPILAGIGEVAGGFMAFIEAFKAGDGEITSAGFPGFMEQAAGIARGALDSIVPVIQTVAEWITGTLVPVVAGLVENFQTYWTQAVEIVQEFVSGMWERLEPVIPTIETIFTTVGEIISGAAAIISEIVAQVTDFIRSAWEVIGDPIMNTVSTVWTAIIGIIDPAIKTVKAVIDTVMAAIRGDWSGVWDGIKNIASGVWDTIKALVSGAIDTVKSVIRSGMDIAKDLFSRAWDAIKTSTSDGVGRVVDWFSGLPGKIVGAITGLPNRMRGMGRNIIQGLINGVKNMAGRLVNSVRGVINDAIAGAKRLLGIASPSKLFMGFGEDTGEGFALGMLGQARAIARAGDTMVGAAIPTSVPTIDVPNLRTRPSSSHATAAPTHVHLHVDGALIGDARSLAREIRDLLNSDARTRGVVHLGGKVLA